MERHGYDDLAEQFTGANASWRSRSAFAGVFFDPAEPGFFRQVSPCASGKPGSDGF
jgi:hypothetical protein